MSFPIYMLEALVPLGFLVGYLLGMRAERNRRSTWLRYLEARLNPPQLVSEKTWFEAMERTFNRRQELGLSLSIADKNARNVHNADTHLRDRWEQAVQDGDEVGKKRCLPRVDPFNTSSGRGPTLYAARDNGNRQIYERNRNRS